MGHFDKINEFHELSDYIKKIANDFFSAREKIRNLEQVEFYSSYINKVQKAYDQLDPIGRDFINNEFFYQKYPFWWEKIYSKTTFYRLKRKSMESFKEAFEHAC